MKILFLAANPSGTQRLKLDEEASAIEKRLQSSKWRDRFELITKWAVGPDELREALLQHASDSDRRVIVHFSGHGEGQQGLVLVEEDKAKPATAPALSELFSYFPSVHCVFLNACYAEVQAQAIVQHVDYVIGMKQAVQDDAAIKFSAAFYHVLGYGRSIEDAFGLGCNAIQLNDGNYSAASRQLKPIDSDGSAKKAEKLESHQIPVLLKKGGGQVDAAAVQSGAAIEKVKDKTISKDEALKQFQAEVRTLLDTGTLTDSKWVQLSTSATVLGITGEEAQQILEAEEQANRRAAESENHQQFRVQIKSCLSNDELTDFEKLQIQRAARTLNLSPEAATRILEEEKEAHYQTRVQACVADPELRQPGWQDQLDHIRRAIDLSIDQANQILERELIHIRQAQQDYADFLQELIQANFYPFNKEVEQGLQEEQRKKQLTAAEVAQVADPILEQAKADYQQRQRQGYEEAFRKAIETAYPLTPETLDQLKQSQQQFELSDEIVDQIQQPLIALKAAEYEEKLKNFEQKYRKALDAAFQIMKLAYTQLNKYQQERGLSDADFDRIWNQFCESTAEQPIKTEEQEEASLQQAYQDWLQWCEQDLGKALGLEDLINAGKELEACQQELRLRDEDAKQIVEPIDAEKTAEMQQFAEAEQQRWQAEAQQQEAETRFAEAFAEAKAALEQPIAAEQQTEVQLSDYETRLKRYEQEFRKAVNFQYPIDCRDSLRKFQRSLGVSDADADRIEAPIVAQKELERQGGAKRQESNPQPAEQRQQEAKQTRTLQRFEFETYVEQLVERTFEQQVEKPGFFGKKRETVWTTAQVLLPILQRGEAACFAEDLDQGVTLEMVAIPGGTFMMGSAAEDYGPDEEGPQHQVTVRPFLMGKFAVTWGQWKAVAALPKVNQELNPDPAPGKTDRHPVTNVSWYDAVEFCDRLSQKTGWQYRLPSEAEWEYACRAGTTTNYHFGDSANFRDIHLGNFDRRSVLFVGSSSTTMEVGSFPANLFGLYDMHGNVWEWCLDYWHGNYQGAPDDGSAWLKGIEFDRVRRGGCHGSELKRCRSAAREFNAATANFISGYQLDIGFRVACSISELH